MRSPRSLGVFSLAFLLGTGCTVQTQAVPDAEPPPSTPQAAAPTPATAPTPTIAVTAPPPAESPCGPRPETGCAAHQNGHCSDALQRQECRGTTWQCPADTIPTTECKCLGKPRPGCSCGDKGWVCADAAAPK